MANHLTGTDLNNASEVALIVNSDVDNSTVLGARDWYYGTDAQPGDDIDFVSVVLHEVAHGLNFFDLTNQDGTFYAGNAPGIWERFLERRDGTDLVELSTTDRSEALSSNDLHWSGDNGIGGNDLTRPRIFAPPIYQLGSSGSHLDESTHESELMSPSYGGPNHEPSSMELGMLVDMGWDVASRAPAEINQLVLGVPVLGDNAIGGKEVLRNQAIGVYGLGKPDSVAAWSDTVNSVFSAISANGPKLRNSHDVNNDGFVSPVDALIIINEVNRGGTRPLTAGSAPSDSVDVNGDLYVSPIDALLVVNWLNRGITEGEHVAEWPIASNSHWEPQRSLPTEAASRRAEANSFCYPALVDAALLSLDDSQPLTGFRSSSVDKSDLEAIESLADDYESELEAAIAALAPSLFMSLHKI